LGVGKQELVWDGFWGFGGGFGEELPVLGFDAVGPEGGFAVGAEVAADPSVVGVEEGEAFDEGLEAAVDEFHFVGVGGGFGLVDFAEEDGFGGVAEHFAEGAFVGDVFEVDGDAFGEGAGDFLGGDPGGDFGDDVEVGVAETLAVADGGDFLAAESSGEEAFFFEVFASGLADVESVEDGLVVGDGAVVDAEGDEVGLVGFVGSEVFAEAFFSFDESAAGAEPVVVAAGELLAVEDFLAMAELDEGEEGGVDLAKVADAAVPAGGVFLTAHPKGEVAIFEEVDVFFDVAGEAPVDLEVVGGSDGSGFGRF
jgi:hypothetical protein